MTLNPFFLQGYFGEQGLMQDLINEHLKIHGIEVYYIPRKILKTGDIIREVQTSKFDDSFLIEAYLNSYEGSSPGSNIMTKFGISLKNEIILTISKERFEEFITPFLANIISGQQNYREGDLVIDSRPKEGDLIYFPLGSRIYEIKYVEFENPFYQLGKNYIFELQCELFEYEDEEIDTDIEEIENILEDTGYITDLKLVAFGGPAVCEATIIPSENIFKGVNKITIINDGYGYKSIPDVIIDPPEPLPADFAPQVSPNIPQEFDPDNFDEDISIINEVSPYSSEAATAVAITTTVNGLYSVSEILITNTGYGYTKPPKVTIVGGGGNGAIARASISDGIIKEINIIDKGDRYYIPPSVTIDSPSGIGITASAVTEISSGRVSNILMKHAGSGYTTKPNVTVSSPPLIGFGTYITSEEVIGTKSGTKAFVKTWIDPGQDKDKILRVYVNSGKFSEGENIIGTASSAVYTLRSYELDTTNDKYSQNKRIEEEGVKIIDFSESNPFGVF